ncbi:hypothetical protein [Pectobacterium brasiliense]|uniref:hypothetical protein n=1 Tax=Pectobacterium brasiliense TaxID=180957 RepID=UPI001F071345|nr:hypothetical protein [Pectobacterium brasiliense]
MLVITSSIPVGGLRATLRLVKKLNASVLKAEQHRERIAAMLATPAEIAAERAEKARRREETQRKFGNKGAAFGL